MTGRTGKKLQGIQFNIEYKQSQKYAQISRPDLHQCFCCNFQVLGLFASHVNANPKNTTLLCYSFVTQEKNDFCGSFNLNFVFRMTFIRLSAKDILFTVCQLVKDNLSGPGGGLVDF